MRDVARTLLALASASLAAGCTLLVSFDDAGACIGAACDGGDDGQSPTTDGKARSVDVTTAHDGTIHRDVNVTIDLDAMPLADATVSDGQPDVPAPIDALPDISPLPDVAVPVDGGPCGADANGAACGPSTACTNPPTCQAGVCTENPLGNGTPCGTAPDLCHLAPVCVAGQCGVAQAAANGTTCGAAPDACHKAPVCESGACGAPAEAANGTKCGAAPDACHDAPKCESGSCAAATTLAEGTNWDTSDTHARCCSGKPVQTTTASNCGVCGWSCASGQSCGVIDGEYLCTGCTADSECASNCCSESPSPNHCSPSNCAGACKSGVCTGGSHCVEGANVDYCSY